MTPTRSARPALLLVVLAALAPACGHRGDPLPPRRRTPPAPHDFRLAQRGDALEARATAPVASVDGIAYETLTIEFLYAEGLKDLLKTGHRLAVQAVPGSRVVGVLPLPTPGTTLRVTARGVVGGEKGPRTLTLSFVAQAPLDPPSELSAVLTGEGVALSWHGVRPKAIAPPVPPPPRGPMAFPGGPRPAGPGPATTAPPAGPRAAPPAGPRATPPAGPPATPPATSPAPVEAPAPTPFAAAESKPGPAPVAEAAAGPEGPRRNGFLVYRRVAAAPFGEPLIGEPLDERSLLDPGAPLGATVCYLVRAVASMDPLVESAPSNEACVDNRDITAPATPAGVAVLPREGGLEVLWGPSADADLAGYRVYRTAPGAPRERIAEVATTRSAFVDETARKGITYAYSVTAFDQAGNESPPPSRWKRASREGGGCRGPGRRYHLQRCSKPAHLPPPGDDVGIGAVGAQSRDREVKES